MRRFVFGLLLSLSALPARAADSTISAMSAASALAGTELLYCVQSGAERKCTPAQISTYIQSLISGDCVIVANSITCTKTGGVAFATVATSASASDLSAGTLAVARGGTGLASGTSGGVPYYSASGTLASSGALTANLPVIGGGAGVAPTVGTRSGNTTTFVTTTGTQTSGDCVKIDANGNHIANGSVCGSGGGGAWTTAVSNAKSADYTTDATDLGKCIAMTTGSSTDKTITLLAAATAGDGVIQCVTKVDSGTNKAIVSNGAAAAWLSAQWDYVIFRSDGSAWNAIELNIAPRSDIFAANGTWTQPPLSASHQVTVISGGASGGNGSVGITGTIRAGGSGGGGGCVARNTFAAAQLTSTVNVVVGATTAGNAASSGTTGTVGTDGNDSYFGATTSSAYVYAFGGLNGIGGSTTGAASGTMGPTGTSAANWSNWLTSNSGAGSVGAAAGTGATRSGFGPGGGGGGGGVSAASVAQNGGVGGGPSFMEVAGASSTGLGGAAGTTASCGAAGANGTTGASNSINPFSFGFGGGAGASCLTNDGGNGGDGGVPGGGGGGSGATNLGNSGASGAGARGEVRVVTYFR